MNIILQARVDFAKTITKGNHYVPVCQTKTGFLVPGDDGYEVDLYLHFFRVGTIEGENIELLPEHNPAPIAEIETEAKQTVPAPVKEVITENTRTISRAEIEAKKVQHPVSESEATPPVKEEVKPDTPAVDFDDDF